MVFFRITGGLLGLLVETLYWCKASFSNSEKVFAQLYIIGNQTLPVGALIALFSGGVLALQAGPTLAQFGLEENVGGLVGLSLVKEIGPIMASILIAGRVGSAMTAELASMSVYEEIDALKTMDINPVRYLVMPRFIATVIALPVLVIYMDVIGWYGGAVVSVVNPEVHLSFDVYYRNLSELVDFTAVMNGLIKAMFFGVIISIVSCYVGLKTKGGPREIGSSVTKAVVMSFVLVLVSDYYITRILLFLNLD
ncbi:MAG: ABC transporter permease [Deltaproteobacteria bacterium]|nr:ABC transporter permease [Deltaproteobacteria bacterium]